MEPHNFPHTFNDMPLTDGLLDRFMANNAGFGDMQAAHREIHNMFLQSIQSNAEKQMFDRAESLSKFLMTSSASQMKSSQTSREFLNDPVKKQQEIVRCSSSESGWVNHQLGSPAVMGFDQTQPASASTLAQPVFAYSRYIFPRFGSFGGLMDFSHMPGSVMNGEKHTNWSQKEKSYTSYFEYHKQMAMSSSFYPRPENTVLNRHHFCDNSESESDEDEISPVKDSPLEAIESPPDSGTKLEPKLNILSIDSAPVDQPRAQRNFGVAYELFQTEENYVKILFLIDQIFHFRVDQENRAHPMFPQEMIPQIFSNIKSIYTFHSEFLLPHLKNRIINWESEPRIGDIVRGFAPFLKMYSEYVTNFDNAMHLIHVLARKHKRFLDIMQEIQKMDECGLLTLTHHMLCPIQRIPRYEMLLKDYLKCLPDGSRDKADTEKALHLVSTAANHVNETMKKIDKFKHLLELEENISGSVGLVSPTRELIKEGKIIKISAQSGDHQERYMFLFSDQLLLCSFRLLPNRVLSGPTYKLRTTFTLDNIEWCEGDNLETTNTFYIRDLTKGVELYTQNVEEKLEWRDALLRAIRDLCSRKASLKLVSEQESELGRIAPKMIKMDGVTKCTDCDSTFNVMKRKHHCHACGLVFCVKCVIHKRRLSCEDGKLVRVCENCFEILEKQDAMQDQRVENWGNEKTMPGAASAMKEDGTADGEGIEERKGVLDVPASATCVQSGYLQLKTQGKPWVKRWFSLHSNFVLYSFVTNKDKPATATPMPGFTVSKVTSLKGESAADLKKMFKIFHSKKTYFFQASTNDEVEKWIQALQMTAQAELPSPK